ncbi:MAG: hypothetical protein NVSMB9_20630 [Isosphaeraceae bacterium]
MERHQSFLERARKGKIDLLFLGDSITEGWNPTKPERSGPQQVWDRYYGPRNAANFGIGGDRTEHVLWRLDHGEAEGIKPRVVVLMIGTNNLGSNPPVEIADGIKAIVDRLRKTLPDSRVLLLGVFPRGSAGSDPVRAQIKEINTRIASLDDGKSIKYLDIGRRFLKNDESISPEIMPDYLHLTREGYRIWADAMEPTLWELMEKD